MKNIKLDALFLLLVVVFSILYFSQKNEEVRYMHAIDFIKVLKSDNPKLY